MERSVLIIDDIKEQAVGLAKALGRVLSNTMFYAAFEQDDIKNIVIDKFYSLAIVDLRMDKFDFNGIDVIKRIFEVNPFAKVIITSAFTGEYFEQIKDILLSGKVVDVVEKDEYEVWIPKLVGIVNSYYNQLNENPSEISKALLQYYAEAKNEIDTYKKGEKFEHFVSLLFGSMGYKQIRSRVKDKSLNEVDLIVRNEIDDSFLNKLGNYFLIECKNKPTDSVTKNDFILFNTKIQNTNGLSQYGFLFTTGYIAWNTYYETLRTSGGPNKVFFFSNPEIEKLIKSKDIKEEFKRIIDFQVKDHK